MFAKQYTSPWRHAVAFILLCHSLSTLALSDSTSTLTGLTQVRIATNCNAYTYADSSDTCNGAVDKFGITLDQLTAWNPVLGRPDGKYCSTQFWAQYDYCVGVDEDSGSNPVISAAPPGTTAAVITGWTSLPSDGSPGEYTVNGLNCTGPGEYYPECWQKLNMNDWLPQLYAQEPQCQSSQIVGCNYNHKP
ncbi:hypothetical protein XANCAGTX0491_001386 [Xanthoria calcicola]